MDMINFLKILNLVFFVFFVYMIVTSPSAQEREQQNQAMIDKCIAMGGRANTTRNFTFDGCIIEKGK